ncbi:MAG: pilus assembly PilX N-terminal domain-containing protein [Gemmatirosa sp.]
MRIVRLRSIARRRPSAARRGMALPVALMLLVVLSTLAASSFTASRQSFRGGRNALIEQRAMSVAEYGLNQQVANWRTELNLPAPRGLAVGRVDSSNVWVAAGDTSKVRITRLTNMLYHVESMGRASIPNPQLTAQRSVGAILRLAYPSIEPRGAITAGGRVDLSGSAIVDGRDYVPYSWNTDSWGDSSCVGMRGSLMPAIAVPPGTSQSDSATRNIPSGAPKVVFDPAAGDSNTYARFGTESWNSLTANANIRYVGGVRPGNSIAPIDSAGTCRYSNTQNWGEPFRGTGAVTSCVNYFPIIYVDGDLELQSNGRGQGILLINGNLKLRGNFDWVGLIIVRDDVDRGNGTANVTGAIMARNVSLTDGGSAWNGNQTVRYSKCAVESALRGSAILVRARDRAWTQLF